MKRFLACLPLVLCAAPALAEPPYYGPMKRWHGIGFEFGYEDAIAKDGSWRVKARTRGGEGIDMAMYRAAERAREAGYPYVQFLRGWAQRAPGFSYAEVTVRPSRSADAPAECGKQRAGACYTADVAEVLRRLGGDAGGQPGVAVTDHYDKFGRAVSYSGFGVGAAGAAAPAAPPPASRPVVMLRSGPSAAERLDAALKAAQPVRGRELRQGWTVSD